METINLSSVHDFFFFKEPDGFYALIDNLSLQSEDLNILKNSFRANLEAAINIGSLPFLMASSAVRTLSFNRVLTAERIRQLPLEAEAGLSSEDEEIAFKRAAEKHELFVESSEGLNYLRDGVMKELHAALGAADFRRAAAELLRETVAMVWGAFETLASDLFRIVVNKKPDLALRVIKENKSSFSMNLSIEDLSLNG